MPLSTDDLMEINQLYARYNTAIDTGDGGGFAGCFVAEGRFDPGTGLVEGREALAGFAEATHKSMPLMRHDATNILIDGDGDRATGSAFLIGYFGGSEYKIIVTGRYADTLTRTPDGWRFSERLFTADK